MSMDRARYETPMAAYHGSVKHFSADARADLGSAATRGTAMCSSIVVFDQARLDSLYAELGSLAPRIVDLDQCAKCDLLFTLRFL